MHLPSVQAEAAVHQLQDFLLICQTERTAYLYFLYACVKGSLATKIKSYNHSHVPEIQNMPLSHRNVLHSYTVIRSPRRATM